MVYLCMRAFRSPIKTKTLIIYIKKTKGKGIACRRVVQEKAIFSLLHAMLGQTFWNLLASKGP